MSTLPLPLTPSPFPYKYKIFGNLYFDNLFLSTFHLHVFSLRVKSWRFGIRFMCLCFHRMGRGKMTWQILCLKKKKKDMGDTSTPWHGYLHITYFNAEDCIRYICDRVWNPPQNKFDLRTWSHHQRLGSWWSAQRTPADRYCETNT